MTTEQVQECVYPWQVAELACQDHPGDLVEIGIGNGESLVHFLRVAARNARRVIGIDHYGTDAPSSYAAPYSADRMTRAVAAGGLTHLLCHHKCSSLSAEAEQAVDCPIAFAYVDGLQYKRAVVSDLDLVAAAGVIVVDDFNRDTEMSQVPRAVQTWRAMMIDRFNVRHIDIIPFGNRYAALVVQF